MNAIIKEGSTPSLKFVGFPCNQFGHQEPADNRTELLNGLRYVRPGSGYVPKFDLFKKIDVNGEKESELYKFVKASCRTPDEGKYKKSETFSDPLRPTDLTWNFEKIIIDANGRPMFRFLSVVEPNDLVDLVQAMSTGSPTVKELESHLLEIDRRALAHVNADKPSSNVSTTPRSSS